MSGTVVDFPAGAVRGTGRVVQVLDLPGGVGVVTDRTPSTRSTQPGPISPPTPGC